MVLKSSFSDQSRRPSMDSSPFSLLGSVSPVLGLTQSHLRPDRKHAISLLMATNKATHVCLRMPVFVLLTSVPLCQAVRCVWLYVGIRVHCQSVFPASIAPDCRRRILLVASFTIHPAVCHLSLNRAATKMSGRCEDGVPTKEAERDHGWCHEPHHVPCNFLFTATYLTGPHTTRLMEIGDSPTVYNGEMSMDIV